MRYGLIPTGPTGKRAVVFGGSNIHIIKSEYVDGGKVDEAAKTIRLVGISPHTVYFADRPERLAGHIKMAAYLEEWTSKAGADNFGKDPPNAALSVFEEGQPNNTLAIIEILNPRAEGKDLVYNYNVVKGKLPAAGGAVEQVTRSDEVDENDPLIAANGRGKSSLLRCLAGQLDPTSGDITRARGVTVGLVEQDVPAALLDQTLRGAVAAASSRPSVASCDFNTEFRSSSTRRCLARAARGFRPSTSGGPRWSATCCTACRAWTTARTARGSSVRWCAASRASACW